MCRISGKAQPRHMTPTPSVTDQMNAEEWMSKSVEKGGLGNEVLRRSAIIAKMPVYSRISIDDKERV